MSGADWQTRRQDWTHEETARTYDERRFASSSGRRKHANDIACLNKVLSQFLPREREGGSPTILDLPCGTGRLHTDLSAAGYRILGTDISAEMLRIAGTSTDTSGLLLSEAEHLPLVDDSADAVLSLRFLFHIRESSVRRRILSEMGRVARHIVIGQVRDPRTVKHRLRLLRRALRLPVALREPTLDQASLEEELSDAGLELLALWPISRFFSDKSLFVARPLRREGGRPVD